MPAVAASPVPAVLENLGPLDEGRFADLSVHLGAVPDPRSRRGRWYPLTAILLRCACAAVSGARSIEEVAEFGQRACRSMLAALGVRRHLLGWRRSPSAVTIGRVLAALDGDALDRGGQRLSRRSAPRRRVRGRPALRIGSSPWTAGPSRARPTRAPRAGISCRPSPTPPSRRSLRSRSGRRRTKPGTSARCRRPWSSRAPTSPSTRCTRSRPPSPGS
ncbi:transposase family protein [Streptomyces sp. NPDC014983]|uniref:transposase family protein n=1 Tax=Streptomyces sp. NPDC014983 TaxID=3364933 RepID=UPI0036FE4212